MPKDGKPFIVPWENSRAICKEQALRAEVTADRK